MKRDVAMNDEILTDVSETGSEKMMIEFQNSADLLNEGIVPFPIKRVEVEVNDVENLKTVLAFYENLIREFWCKGKLKV